MNNGWIKLHRKMLDNPIVCKDSEHLSVWVYLLLKATHDDYPMLFNGNKIILKPGQLITGRKSISKQLSISESKVKRILLCFESDQQIDRQRGNQSSLISIVRWVEYQNSDQPDGQPMTSQWTADDQPVTTNKKVKNIRTKEERDIDEKLVIPLKDFADMRKSIKAPLTEKAIDMLLKKLNMLSGGDVEKEIEILNKSTLNSWKSVYDLKDNFNRQSTSNTFDKLKKV